MFPEDTYHLFAESKIYQYAAPGHTCRPLNVDRLEKREALLRESLELVKHDEENGFACHNITEAALDLGLFDLAVEAFREMEPDSDYICEGVQSLFESHRYWPLICEELLIECVEKVLRLNDSIEHRLRISGYRFILSNDEKSIALAMIGRYLLANRRYRVALKLWNRVPDRYAVEDILFEICEKVIDKRGPHSIITEVLMPHFDDKNRKAALLVKLSNFGL